MKKVLLPMAAAAIILSSCSTNTKDSYSTINFGEYNLITDLDNPSEPAQTSSALYGVTLNWSKECADVVASDLVIDSQKISFETDTMALRTAYLVAEGSNSYVEMGMFGKKGKVGKTVDVSNLDALFTPGVYYVNNLPIPEFETVTGTPGMRLVMGYDLNSRYHVQTFWPMSFYVGKTYAVDSGNSFTTSSTAYRVELNFEKKTARVAVYYPEYSVGDKENDIPKAIVMENIPISFNHDGYFLAADAPKTRVLGKNDKGTPALVDSDKYKATDFSLMLTSKDLTEVSITYKIDGKSVSFNGCSIVKANKQ